MSTFQVGDKVTLTSCTGCPPGEILGFTRNRVIVELNDMPGTKWLLRPESLRLIPTAEQVTR
jgi:hypothetical protein